MNKKSGIFGKWSNEIKDDLKIKNGMMEGVGKKIKNFESIKREFEMNWILEEREDNIKGVEILKREFGRNENLYEKRKFVKEFRKNENEIINNKRNRDIEMEKNMCGEEYKCMFEYEMSMKREMDKLKRKYMERFVKIK
jgi:hypothetical protein